MENLPEYDEDGSELIDYQNVWRNIETHEIVGLDCFEAQADLDVDENFIMLKLSEQEFVEMFSALYFGSELNYPDRFLQIVVNFLKGLHCEEQIMASLCARVAECIATPNSLTQNAILNLTIQAGANYNSTDPTQAEMPERFKEEDRAKEIITQPDCNQDKIWSGTLNMVKRLAEMSQDFLEDLVAEADGVQRTARMVALVPILGDAIGESLLAFAEVVPDILDLYNSWQSDSQLEDVACDLFCIHADTCSYPTFDELKSYYASAGITGWSDFVNLSVNAVIDLMTGSSLVAAQTAWYSMNTFTLYILYMQSEFLGQRGTRNLQIWSHEGELVPSDAWQLLCDCGAGWKWQYSATACDYGLPAGWSLDIVAGLCGDGLGGFDGIYALDNPGGNAHVETVISFGSSRIVNKVYVYGSPNEGAGYGNGLLRVTVGGETQETAFLADAFHVYTFEFNTTSGDVVIYAEQTIGSDYPLGVVLNAIGINQPL